MSEHQDVYFARADYLEAARAPDYQTSARYRQEVADKLARSLAAGSVTPLGEFHQHGNDPRSYERVAVDSRAPEGLYGSHNPMPGADPLWAEAARIDTGHFDGPEAVARAMAAPQFDADPSYRRAVQAKVERSIGAGFINSDLTARDPSSRSNG